MEPNFLSRIEKRLKKLNSITSKKYADDKKGDLIFKGRYSKNNILFGVQVVIAFATLVALAFTYSALNRADKANTIAQKSLDSSAKYNREMFAYTKYNDSVNDRQNRIKDSISKDAFDSSLAISNRNTKISLQALEETQNRFEIENKPFLRVIPTSPNIFEPFNIKYQIVNYGKMPVIINYIHGGVVYSSKNEEEQIKWIQSSIDTIKPISKGEIILNNNEKDTIYLLEKPYIIPDNDIIDIMNDRKKLYQFGRIWYLNTSNNKRIKLDYIIRFIFIPIINTTYYNVRYRYIYRKESKY